MPPIATDVAWSVCVSVCLCVCLLDAPVSPTKTENQIKMPFGLWTWVGQETMHWVGPDPPKGVVL